MGRSTVNVEPRYRFTGQERDEEISVLFYNFRARMFDSNHGIFYAADPAHSTFSPYGYARQNPVIFIDKTGSVDAYYESRRAWAAYLSEHAGASANPALWESGWDELNSMLGANEMIIAMNYTQHFNLIRLKAELDRALSSPDILNRLKTTYKDLPRDRYRVDVAALGMILQGYGVSRSTGIMYNMDDGRPVSATTIPGTGGISMIYVSPSTILGDRGWLIISIDHELFHANSDYLGLPNTEYAAYESSINWVSSMWVDNQEIYLTRLKEDYFLATGEEWK